MQEVLAAPDAGETGFSVHLVSLLFCLNEINQMNHRARLAACSPRPGR
jgi:hypothetical protein